MYKQTICGNILYKNDQIEFEDPLYRTPSTVQESVYHRYKD